MSTLKKVSWRTYFFQKLNEFSQGNNVLDTPTSSPDAVLVRDTCVSSLSWIELIVKREPISTLKNLFQEIFLTKTNTVLPGKLCAM
jgi:hypothetical protein